MDTIDNNEKWSGLVLISSATHNSGNMVSLTILSPDWLFHYLQKSNSYKRSTLGEAGDGLYV